MSYGGLLKLSALAIMAIACELEAVCGPGEATGRILQCRAAALPSNADFKALVWYRTADPVGTFKYEIYDLRKGEYTEKVDDWVKNVRANYPAFYLVVRDVDLKREKGETEFLKVGSVISRELVVAAKLAGIVLEHERFDSVPPGSRVARRRAEKPNSSGRSNRPMGFGVFGGTPGADQVRGSRLDRLPGSAGGNRDYVKPSPTPFPVPVPFPHVPR